MYNAAKGIDSTGPLFAKSISIKNHSINLIFQLIKFTIPMCMVL